MAVLSDAFTGVDLVARTGKVQSRATVKVPSDNRAYGALRPRSNITLPNDRRSYGNFAAKFTANEIADTRSVAKVQPRQNISTVNDFRSFGKVNPRSNIASVFENRTVAKTESLVSTGNTLYSRYPSGIPSLGGITYPLPGTVGFELVDLPTFDYRSYLTPFNDVLTGNTFAVTGQDNVKYNVVNQYIFELNVLSVTTSNTGSEQTIYYTPLDNSIRIPAGFYVKISSNNASWTVLVKSATANSITFDTVSGFPTTRTGALTIQSSTSFVYPKSKVDGEIQSYISANGIDLRNYSNRPRDLLSVAEVKPNFRSYTTLNIDRDISGVVHSPAIDRLETYNEVGLIGDFQLSITGESNSVQYRTALWYINDSNILTYSTAPVSVKILYFSVQDAVPFPTGTTVRITNTQTNYRVSFAVIAGTNSSITIATSPSTPNPAIGSTIERAETSVYKQNFVTTTQAPTNARENLYYSLLSPGLKGLTLTVFGNSIASTDVNLQVNKLSSAQIIKGVNQNLTAGKTQSAAKVQGINVTVSTSSLIKPIISVRGERGVVSNNPVEAFFSQFATPTTTKPVSARDRFYYFNVAPGYRYNKSIEQGLIYGITEPKISIENLSKQLAKLTSDQNRLFKADKLGAATVLKSSVSDINIISYVNKFTVRPDTTQVFNTPTLSNLRAGAILKSDNTRFDISTLKKQLLILKSDNTTLPSASLKSSAIVKADATNISRINFLNPFRIKNTQLFESPSSNTLERPVSVVKGDSLRLFIGKTSSSANLKADFVKITLDRLENPIIRLSPEIYNLSSSRLENPIVKLSPDYSNYINADVVNKFIVYNNEIFYTPVSQSLYDGFVVKDVHVQIKSSKLSSNAVLRTDRNSLLAENFEKYIIPKEKIVGVESPTLSLLNKGFVIKSTGVEPVLGKLAASTKVVADNARAAVIPTINLWESQFTNYVTTGATNAKSRFQYFNIAPGYRYNKSIEQGLLIEPDRTKIETTTLSTFDNVGFTAGPFLPVITTTDPVFEVVGRNSAFVNNVTTLYISDDDILTLVPIQSPIATLYFLARENLPVPFPAGTTVRVKHRNTYFNRDFTVVSATAGSVTFLDPGDLPTTSGMTIERVGTGYDVTVFFARQINLPYPTGSFVTLINNQNNQRLTVQVKDAGTDYITYVNQEDSFNLPLDDSATIASASISVFETKNVVVTAAPKNAREMLYYSTLARGYKYGQLSTPFGSSVTDESARLFANSLQKDQFKLQAVDRDTDISTLEKPIVRLKASTESLSNIHFLEPLKLKDFTNQVFFVDAGGLIIRLKTGIFNKMHDIAVKKKEPIQFWN